MRELLSPAPLKTAEEVAIACLMLGGNIAKAAEVIEAYARSQIQAAQLDRSIEVHNRLARKPIDGPLGD
jgi:hypothetical protein